MTGCKGFKVNSGSFVIELNTLSSKKTKFVLRELSIERMEMVSGGGLDSCFCLAMDLIGITATIAMTPLGPIGWATAGWLYTAAVASGVGTGLSLGGCIS